MLATLLWEWDTPELKTREMFWHVISYFIDISPLQQLLSMWKEVPCNDLRYTKPQTVEKKMSR
jgi:hypothetical protein